MNKVSTIGLDLAKNVFQVHGADASGPSFFASDCGEHTCWNSLQLSRRVPLRWKLADGRITGAVSSVIRPSSSVDSAGLCQAFVKRQKNDAADAEAICEASQRPTMRFVAVKSETAQGAAVVFEHVICWCASARK